MVTKSKSWKHLKQVVLYKTAMIFLNAFLLKKNPIIRLGSNYGGWSYLDRGDMRGCLLISAGLGEDASFDIEFIQKNNSRVLMIDPTPKAKIHFDEIVKSLGSPKTKDYSSTGRQEIASYNLTSVRSEQVELLDKALWDKDDSLKFYSPPNPDHVSYSVTNMQGSSDYMSVQSIDVKNLLDQYTKGQNYILKIDIEGAEHIVLWRLFETKNLPSQVLLEFDELLDLNLKKFLNVIRSHFRLIMNGYRLCCIDKPMNFLYVRF